MAPVRIGFTGSRTGMSQTQAKAITDILDSYSDIVVLHGDCVGADTEFHKLCVAYRVAHPEKTIVIHIYPPTYANLRSFNNPDKLMPAKYYLERNKDIIMNSDFIIACPVDKDREEVRSGTWSTIRHAKVNNLQVHIL